MMRCHATRGLSVLATLCGICSRLIGSSASPQPSPTCTAITDIIDSYGTLEGTLGGVQILIPNLSSETGSIIRQFMTLLDSATLNVWALFDAVPCKRYQAPTGDEEEDDDGDEGNSPGSSMPSITITSRALPELGHQLDEKGKARINFLKRQQPGGGSSSPASAVPIVCQALARVSADVAQTVSLMDRLTRARGLPAQLYIDPLQEAVDDAKVKIGVVQAALKVDAGC